MRYSHVGASYIFESINEDLMRILVVAKLLFLACNIDGNFYCLSHVANSSVEFKGPLRLLWNVISFTHQVVDQLVS